MPIILKPYQANPAFTRRVYPLQHMGDYLQERANMARAYAASSSGPPDCSKAPPCTCCKKPSSIYYSWKGPAGQTNGKNCSEAEANYRKAHGDCNAVSVDLPMDQGFTDTNPAVTIKGGKKTGEVSRLNAKGEGSGHAGAGGGKDVEGKSLKSKGKGKGLAGAGGQAESGGTQPTDTTPSTDTAGTPQDLFASIPQVSGFFNSMYTKVCSSNTKIPFICNSLAYFEIAFIVIIAVVLLLVLGGGRKRRR